MNSDKNRSGKIFDLTAGVVFDGLVGQAAGSIASNLLNIFDIFTIRIYGSSKPDNQPAVY